MHNIEHMTPIGVVEVGATLVLASGKLHIHCDYETHFHYEVQFPLTCPSNGISGST
jgi:hypothetical protein